MDDGKPDKLSRRDLFKGFMRQLRRQEEQDESSGMAPEVLKADWLLREGKYQEAAEAYARCLDKEPGHLEALRRLGFCRMKLNQTEEARRVWEKLKRYRPGDDYAALYTGLSHAMDGEAEKAVAVWRTYLNIKQPLIQRQVNLILALHERGDQLDPAQMVRSIEEAILEQKKTRR